jgi:protocatechuate 3,4-dioxygenase beta subunit
MTRSWLVVALCCGVAHSATIRGVVLDNFSGRPLARALVELRPVEGTGGEPLSARANRLGQFTFSPIGGGMYLLSASRTGFAPFQYGQKDFKAAGKPVSIDENGALFLDIRLRRYGAISGTALDENDIGIPDQQVVAYGATRPLAVAGRATTDERGIYRIHGLEPGTYIVRTTAKDLEDGSGILPTFSKETMLVDQAIAVDVDLDQQVDDANIRPVPGKLFHVRGKVATFPPVQATVILISDAGRMRTGTAGDGSFSFEWVAPGFYELTAEGNDLLRRGGALASYQQLSVDNDMEGVQLQLHPLPEAEFRIHDGNGNPIETAKVTIMARRKSLDGPGPVEKLKLDKGVAALAPGIWEMTVIPPPAYYTGAFSGSRPRESERGRADGWNEVELASLRNIIEVTLSSHPASVHGLVTGSGRDPVPGAPVYLEAFDQDSHKRLADLRTTRTDVRGQYRFNGLAPGVYRILSTFEYDKPDSQTIEAAGSIITLSEATDVAQDLDLYVR